MNKEDIKHRVDYLFPMPVYQVDNYFLPKKIEKRLIKECEDDPSNNHYGNLTSTDRNILDKEYLSDLKEYFNKHLTIFANNVLCIQDFVKFYITQSWLNINKKDTSHHLHYHTNSFISGVYYLTDGPPISFYKKNDLLQNFDFDFKEMNALNTQQIDAEIQKGRLILFPSVLSHEVRRNFNNETRVSLSFNSFFKGTLNMDGSRSTDLTIL